MIAIANYVPQFTLAECAQMFCVERNGRKLRLRKSVRKAIQRDDKAERLAKLQAFYSENAERQLSPFDAE